MLYDLDSFARLCDRRYSVADLTLIVAVRCHEENPWVPKRLIHLGRYYDPMPRVILVDFGSTEPYAAELRRISAEAGFEYVFEADHDTFSLARARNIGAHLAQSELLFFSDVDCFGERNLFQRLVEQANTIELGACFDQIIDLPVHHLSESASEGFFAAPDPDSASRDLARNMARSLHAARDTVAEYVDPSSNFFLCHRRYYDLVGGFNENFRGHGSEDFEFQLRYALIAGQFPMPASAGEDHYGVTRDAFYKEKQYKGFRRLGELMAFQSLAAGLRIAHLWHPRPRATDSWYRNNDWKR
ncbi:MAG TPA: glycosyltransferase, partial [Polyangiaceae bacterium]|nr:glycosyltransferase [Polyangiaceae bacterium]